MNRLRTGPIPVVHLRDALRSDLDALPDAELLDRFARYADHPAFEVLLRRHGPMVFVVCRRTLTNPADAEDAFQATFLVFIRKARSLRRADRLGPWLYGVACRVAMKARARAARLAEYRTEVREMIPDFNAPAAVPDWLPVLDTELAALPAKYRDALVMCELEGASRADAAKTLGVPEGTLSSRLARGRELLRRRLLKHGALLPAGGLVSLFTANGVGRATVPAVLLTRTSELATIVTGAVTVGTVPVGAAQLTDEVLKSMFLTKLRSAGVAVFALVLVATGLAAAWSGGTPGAVPDTQSTSAAPAVRAPALVRQPDSKEPVASGSKLSDRDAMQGLWVVEKYEVGTGFSPNVEAQTKRLVGKMYLLVAGDVWWEFGDSPIGVLMPVQAKIDSSKNPKWLDVDGIEIGGVHRRIYELSGDCLRVCGSDNKNARPAEFNAAENAGLMVTEFRRDKMPPAARDKTLTGAWEKSRTQVDDKGLPSVPSQRVEILDTHLFAFSTEKGRGSEWFGGHYTVDTTKNPKWIEVALVAPLGDEKITKLYGCYEVADGRLKMALGTKRATRPLDFDAVPNVLVFDVKATKEPFKAPASAPEKVIGVPTPHVESRVLEEDERIQSLMKTGDFGGAEAFIRKRLADYKGLELAARELQLGICLTQRAAESDAGEAIKLRTEAAGHFREAITKVEAYQKIGGVDKRATWVRTQAELHSLSALLRAKKPDEVITAAGPMLERYKGTVEELIILSLVYHAHSKRGDTTQVQKTLDRMKTAFEKLKDKPGAFSATSGEYSKEYWEKIWFARDAVPTGKLP